MSESIIIVALAACWAGYLGWYWRQRFRSSQQEKDQVNSFSQGLGTLGSARLLRDQSPTAVYQSSSSPLAPRSVQQAARRRRDVGITLGLLCLTTLFAALAFGLVVWVVHVLVDIAAGSFAYFAFQRRSIAAEREMKVHMLYPDRMVEQPPLAGAGRAVNG
ncbi:MAG: hypothetical protein OXF75_12775 [Acidimicrobiaceae bacterium]|nr:hypothetical protein [Acidimicrobiaceae bacterium]